MRCNAGRAGFRFDVTLKAAEQGLATAQENLAGMYFNGIGVPKDCGEVVAQSC